MLLVKKIHVWLVVILLLLVPLGVQAQEEIPPTPQPHDRITAPDIIGVNPNPVSETGALSEIEATGNLEPLGVAAPPTLSISQSAHSQIPEAEKGLAVPMRYQGMDDSTCGIQALGMVMDFMALETDNPEAPNSQALLGALVEKGLYYPWGTGVEELAYLARQKGYAGSYAFHEWTLSDVQKQLAQGHPVVVSLGNDEEGQAGHFVTVTGFSEDGQWVSYNDPAEGEIIRPAAEFLAAWQIQGTAGIIVQREALAVESDPMRKVMGVFSALSALSVVFSQLSQEQRRILNAGWLKKSAGSGGKQTLSTWPTSRATRAEPSWGERVKQAERALYATQKQAQQIESHARQEGNQIVASAQEKQDQSQEQVKAMLAQARSQGQTWIGEAEAKLKQARRKATRWQREAAQRGQSWVNAAVHYTRVAQAQAAQIFREAIRNRRRGREYLREEYRDAARLIRHAASKVQIARENARRHQAEWQRKGQALIAVAQKDIHQAQWRADALIAKETQSGSRLLNQAKAQLKQAESRANQKLAEAKTRATDLVAQSRQDLERAQKAYKQAQIKACHQKGDYLSPAIDAFQEVEDQARAL